MGAELEHKPILYVNGIELFGTGIGAMDLLTNLVKIIVERDEHTFWILLEGTGVFLTRASTSPPRNT